ncbi:MAG: DUF4115 domain-containing protein [Alphaproteobacteria bacterium]|nr:MAG: DUF4115 domain-containing protein [Alphaproteobacteria bacterium]
MVEADIDQFGTGPTIGERLRVAREAKGMSLDDVARQTRIPIRHLQHIEAGEWDSLPASTYSIGFARSYANAIGMDGPAIGAELREQLGLSRGSSASAPAYYEPADAARVPPRWLAIVAALVAIALVVGYLVWRNAALGDGSSQSEIATAPAEAPAPTQQAAAPATPAPVAGGPVVLTATDDVWLRIYEGNGGPKLYEGTLKSGERYQIPAGAKAPQIMTGRPNVLNVTVGGTAIPPLGPPEKRIKDVSLLGADLAARAQGGGAAPAAPAPAGR